MPIPKVAAEGSGTKQAIAACCLGDDNTSQLKGIGLGQENPSAANLSVDPRWRVYGFARDGISYYQVNDAAGRVQLIIGTLDRVFWALPAGETSSQVVLPPQRAAVIDAMDRSEVYQHPTFTLVRYRNGGATVWSVEHPGTGR
jgi:hypothetical protein